MASACKKTKPEFSMQLRSHDSEKLIVRDKEKTELFDSRNDANSNPEYLWRSTYSTSNYRPVICASLFGIHFPAILDTGSDNSVIGQDTINLLKQNEKNIMIIPSKTILTFGGGVDEKVEGEVKLKVTWNEGKNTNIKFLLLPSLILPVLLGRDFIIKSNILLYLQGKAYAIGGICPTKFYPFDKICPHTITLHFKKKKRTTKKTTTIESNRFVQQQGNIHKNNKRKKTIKF